MRIVIDIEKDKITLRTNHLDNEIEYGWKRESTGLYVGFGKHPEDLAFLSNEEVEALEDIPLTDLLYEFNEDYESEDGE